MGNSFLLIIVGLLIFHLIISDKWKCFEGTEGSQGIQGRQGTQGSQGIQGNSGAGINWYRDWETDRKSTRLNSSHITRSRMPSSA